MAWKHFNFVPTVAQFRGVGLGGEVEILRMIAFDFHRRGIL